LVYITRRNRLCQFERHARHREGRWAYDLRGIGRSLMGENLTRKIIREHLVSGKMEAGDEIALRIDQTLTQDATGTMAYLQFEALGLARVKTELSVSYVDHNMLQQGFENADDHRYLQSVAAKYGIYFSRPGNGICHQVHLERFGAPGKTLLGSDSHTPTSGGLGALAIGAGGLDVAVAMGGEPFHLAMPRVHGIRLTGALSPWVSAKDVILEVLRRLTVKGGVGKVIEYFGEGVRCLSVPERATITNMGAELGATTSIFPSDERTREYLAMQGREEVWTGLAADEDAEYDEVDEIDLTGLEPLVARPHSPDNVCPVSELAGMRVHQVIVGSCTNSSYRDLNLVASILKGRKVHPETGFVVAPGSRQVLEEIARSGALADIISAGARVIESACGPCIGMGQAPPSGGVSVRTFNRNFEGRSGTADAQVYLVGPEVAVAAAVRGEFADPRELGDYPDVSFPDRVIVDDSMILAPSDRPEDVEIVRGPNIQPLPLRGELEDTIRAEILLKVGDNITTDHIMPAGAKILPLRSNIPAISEYVFSRVDADFARKAKAAGSGAVIGGANYGQGSSREHAALAPMYLGVKLVVVRSFARIHKANLVNFGILPLLFREEADYEALSSGDVLIAEGVRGAVREGDELVVRRESDGREFRLTYELSERERGILLAGGLLNLVRGRDQG
jgi:aconitate hydratase